MGGKFSIVELSPKLPLDVICLISYQAPNFEILQAFWKSCRRLYYDIKLKRLVMEYIYRDIYKYVLNYYGHEVPCNIVLTNGKIIKTEGNITMDKNFNVNVYFYTSIRNPANKNLCPRPFCNTCYISCFVGSIYFPGSVTTVPRLWNNESYYISHMSVKNGKLIIVLGNVVP